MFYPDYLQRIAISNTVLNIGTAWIKKKQGNNQPVLTAVFLWTYAQFVIVIVYVHNVKSIYNCNWSVCYCKCCRSHQKVLCFTCFIYCISTFQVVIVNSGTLVKCLSKGCNILMLTNFSKSLLGLNNANCNFLLASDVLFLNYV